MSSLMRKVKIIIVAVILAIISAACEPTEQSREPDDESKTVIGFSMATLKEDRWLQDRDIFIAKAKQEGFEVIVKNANNDSKLQIEQVNDMIASGIDVLVIVPHDSEEAAACVSQKFQDREGGIGLHRIANQRFSPGQTTLIGGQC